MTYRSVKFALSQSIYIWLFSNYYLIWPSHSFHSIASYAGVLNETRVLRNKVLASYLCWVLQPPYRYHRCRTFLSNGIARLAVSIDVVLWIHYYSLNTNFRGFRGNSWTTKLKVQRMTNFIMACMQTSAKPRNQISMNMQVFLNPQKLVPTKINESTVIWNIINTIIFCKVTVNKRWNFGKYRVFCLPTCIHSLIYILT